MMLQQLPPSDAICNQPQDSIMAATGKGSYKQLSSQAEKEPFHNNNKLPSIPTNSHFPSHLQSDNTMRIHLAFLFAIFLAPPGVPSPIPPSITTTPLLLTLALHTTHAKPFLHNPYPQTQPMYPDHRTRGDIPSMPSHSVYFRKLGRVSPSLGYVTPVLEIDVADVMRSTKEGLLQGTRMAMMLAKKKEVSRAQAATAGTMDKDAKSANQAITRITGQYHRYYVADSKWAEQIKGGLLRLAKAKDYLESASSALGINFEEKHKAKREAWHLFHDRSKPVGQRLARSLTALLLGGTALASTVMGLFTQAQLVNIKKRAQSDRADLEFQIKKVENNRRIDSEHTWKALETLASYTHLSMFTLKAEAVMNGIATDADATTDILTAIQHGRLSPKAINTGQAKDIFANVAKQASKFGFVPLIHEAYQLFQCTVSYTATKQGILTLYIHVPVTADTPMDLFQYMPMPVYVNNSLITLTTTTSFYATATTARTAFRAFSAEQLLSCNRQQDLYLCPDANVVATRPPTEKSPPFPEYCLNALYERNWPAAFATCQVSFQEPQEAAFQVGPTDFVTYSRVPSKGDIICSEPSMSRHDDWQLARRAHVHIPAGCHGATNTHKITAALDSQLEPHRIKSYSWPDIYTSWFRAAERDIEVAKTAGAITRDPAAAVRFQHLAALRAEEMVLQRLHWVHPKTTSATAIIALLLVLTCMLTAAYILWALRRHRCNVRYRQQRLRGQTGAKDSDKEKDPKLAEWEKQLAQASLKADGKELAQLILHPPKKYRPRDTAPPGIIQWLWPPVEEEAQGEGLYPLI